MATEESTRENEQTEVTEGVPVGLTPPNPNAPNPIPSNEESGESESAEIDRAELMQGVNVNDQQDQDANSESEPSSAYVRSVDEFAFDEVQTPATVTLKSAPEKPNNPLIIDQEKNQGQKSGSNDPVLAINKEYEYFSVIANKVLSANLAPRGVNTVEKVIIILTTGKELGLPPMAALQNIHVIEGRATLGIHAVTTLVKRARIDHRTVKDYEPVMKLIEGVEQVVNYVTEIEFSRRSELTGEIVKEISRFTYHDAKIAGLLAKDNWKKYPKQMIWTRCYVLGARRVAPEALLGMYEMSEMADVHDIPYTVEEVK